MELEVETKDTTALADAEVAEMAELGADGSGGYDLGLISKQKGEWVLVTRAYSGSSLAGFALATLERIGGTPSILVGMAAFAPGEVGAEALDAVLRDLYHRALLAFPDEDVLLGTRILAPSGYEAFRGLKEVAPRPEHRASGEERAWGRRLAKRFGMEGKLNDRTFVLAGTGEPPPALDYRGPLTLDLGGDAGALFEEVDAAKGDSLVVFGWAMAEDLVADALPS